MGNIVLAPLTLLYFVAYVAALLLCVSILANTGRLMIALAWTFGQLAGSAPDPTASRIHRIVYSSMRRMEKLSLATLEAARANDVIVFAKNDEISQLFDALQYVQRMGDAVRCVKLVSVYSEISQIPPELEANSKRELSLSRCR